MNKLIAVAILLIAAPVFAQRPDEGKQDPLFSMNIPKDFIVATIDGEEITLDQVTEYSKTMDHRKLEILNHQLHDLRENALRAMLGERILKRLAAEKKVTIQQYLEATVKVEPPTPEEVLQVMSTRPPGGDEEGAKRLATQYVRDQKRALAYRRFIDELIQAEQKKTGKPLVIHLEPPRTPIEVRPSDSVRGSGPIELVEFSDFECPFCAKAQPVLKEVLAQFEGKIKHVWRDFPLPNHQYAMVAAIAGRCANEQGKFWEYKDRLFATQQLTPIDLRQHAIHVGLDLDSFNTCLANGQKYRGEIEQGRNVASVMSTPTVFINGRAITGMAPKEEYVRIISAELARVSR